MENLIKELLIQQIKDKHITVRALHGEISKLCENNHNLKWISMATLERRLQHPADISEEELYIIRDATQNIVSDSVWIHIKRNITEKMRYKYAMEIDDAVSHGFALRQKVDHYDNFSNDKEYVCNILAFYRSAPIHIKRWWLNNLETYLQLPDLSKAVLMCSSYIGHSIKKDLQYNNKIIKFLDYFPIFQGINSISSFQNNELHILSRIMSSAADVLDENSIPDQLYECAKSKMNIKFSFVSEQDPVDTFETSFCRLAVSYKHSITDYKTDAQDFIHSCCFILFIEKVEWLLAFATTIFFFRLKHEEDRYNIRREYHDRGCTGFRFTDKELDYLCEFLYIIEK